MRGTEVHRHAAQGLRPTGRLRGIVLCVGVLVSSGFPSVSVHAIEVHPTAAQIQAALDRGKEAATEAELSGYVSCSIRRNRRAPFQRVYDHEARWTLGHGDAYGFARNPAR